MATTHAFVGLALASAYAALGGDYGTVAAAGALAGGVFPDLDLPFEHRKTLHFPEYYAALSAVAAAVAIARPTALAVGAAAFLVAAAAHAASDVLGGGLAARPWQETSDRGVFLHRRGGWARPRRYVRYDGAPEDFAVGLVLAVPGWLVFDGWVRNLVLGGVVVSAIYVLFRKRLPTLEERYLR